MPAYFVYIVKCADSSFYTGISTDYTRRVTEHNTSTKGAKYTTTRRPVQLVYLEEWPDRSSASKREYVLKRLSHGAKEALSSCTQRSENSQ